MADHAHHERATTAVTLDTSAASVGAARRHVAEVLAGWGVPEGGEALDTVRLIVSELATNAVQHTRGESPDFQVDVRRESTGRVGIGVTDACPRPPQRLPAAVRQDNGRGMDIIRALLGEVGGRLSVVPSASGGKTVWAVLPWERLTGEDSARALG